MQSEIKKWDKMYPVQNGPAQKKWDKMYPVQNVPKQKKEEKCHEDDRNINYNSKHINIDITNNNAIGKYYKEKI